MLCSQSSRSCKKNRITLGCIWACAARSAGLATCAFVSNFAFIKKSLRRLHTTGALLRGERAHVCVFPGLWTHLLVHIKAINLRTRKGH